MIGKKLAHYDILALIGKGGMGEVYRAHDTKLGRDVAVKILPADLATDPERLARFRREAQMLASVNHPNIASIYGLEQSEGQNYLIMELAEGEDLAARIGRGPVPLDEALAIASDIARGLEEAHEKSIVHRDLKPANVMVSSEGKTKILDFGLARAYSGEPAVEGDPALSPTVTAAMTQAGVILGSAAYMSPEQAKGRPVDRRADIWAFGVILFEMITGRRLFTGETVSETMASVLKDPIDWERLPENLPPSVRALLERCLERDPKLRLRDIGEARIHLQDPEGSALLHSSLAHPPLPPAAAAPRRTRVPWLLFGLASLAALFFAFRDRPSPSMLDTTVVQAAVESPGNVGFHLNGANPAATAVSPDGRRIVFGARTENGGHGLWVKDISSPEAVPISGTEDAQYPFWSPDSRSVAYFSRGALRIVDLDGRTSRELVRCEDMKGGCWLENGTILLAPTPSSGIARVSAEGGDLTFLTDTNGDPPSNSHRLPRPLRDGKHFLFAARKTGTRDNQPVGVMLGSLDGSAPRELLAADGQAEYANGCIVYEADSKIYARPFDVDKLEFSGSPSIVAENAGVIPGAAVALFSTSRNGTLVYHPGHDQTISVRLAWFDFTGTRQGFLGESAGIGSFTISPDGRRVALTNYENRNGTGDLYLDDIGSNIRTRLTFDPAEESFPIWSPDSKTLYYTYLGQGPAEIRALNPDSREEPLTLFRSPLVRFLGDVSPDGQWLSMTVEDSTTHSLSAAVLDLKDPKAFESIDPTATETYRSQFSPDGRWIAYQAQADGLPAIFLKSFPLSSRKWQVTNAAALTFDWDPSGQRILYQDRGDRLFAIDIDLTGNTPQVGETRLLFDGFAVPMTRLHTFQVMPDGSKILVTDAGGAEDARPARIILNWPLLLPAGS